MLGGNLVACANARGLLVRVGEAHTAESARTRWEAMVMNGRQTKGFVRVEGRPDCAA